MFLAVAGALAFGLGGTALARQEASPAGGMDAGAKIASAVSAAPSSVSADATVLDWEMDDAGAFVVLREGSNDWTCFPDGANTPSNDPMCLDPRGMDWLNAILANEEPNLTAPGVVYMLQGGSDASNTNPFAEGPAEGEEWVTTPPHVMLILPGELDQAAFSTDHHSGGPFIMWAGTPYEHIMLPVADPEGMQ
jgi:hypothetical protein